MIKAIGMPFSPGRKALRKGRRSILNQYYLVTASARLRKPVFSVSEYATVVLDSLKWLDAHHLVQLDTAVVMPDHMHCIAQLKKKTLAEVMQTLKGFTARKINILMGRSGPLWQPGYHDHAIRKDESLNDFRRYCIYNPVRAKLVTRYDQYPHWYCAVNDRLSL